MADSALDTITRAVRDALAGMDASHDMSHVMRVHALAVRMAEKEGITDPKYQMMVSLGALLHDVADRKYSGSETATEEVATTLMDNTGIEKDVQEGVLAIIRSVSFNSEIGGAKAKPEYEKVCFVVQDADRLEAIGAIGISRCLLYGGAKKRPLYNDADLDPAHCEMVLKANLTKEEYAKYSETTVGHFYAKLLRLKSMMKTATGRELAEARHKYMEGFLDQLYAEIRGER